MRQDFYLAAPQIAVAPVAFGYTLELGQQFTETAPLVISNTGPATANAVQVVDAFPREFDFVSATASDGSTCNSGMTCDLGEITATATVTITLVVDVAVRSEPAEAQGEGPGAGFEIECRHDRFARREPLPAHG